MLPAWLIKATGANAFANNPANGFQPTLGDALQGVGHSMMEHYRRGTGQEVPQSPVNVDPTGSYKPSDADGIFGALGGGGLPSLGLASSLMNGDPLGLLGALGQVKSLLNGGDGSSEQTVGGNASPIIEKKKRPSAAPAPSPLNFNSGSLPLGVISSLFR